MSRIGKLSINIPEKVKVKLDGQKILVDGPKGSLSRILPSLVCCSLDEQSNSLVIEKTQNTMIERKKISQPSQVKTCGSTFKNLGNKKVWEVIKQTGCDKFREGDAVISQKHCNFFINEGNANSSDIENLIDKVKKRVNEKTGVNLELEIKIIGE